MPTLNDATAVYVGTTPAQAVYLGDVKVWPTAAAALTWRWSRTSRDGRNPGKMARYNDTQLEAHTLNSDGQLIRLDQLPLSFTLTGVGGSDLHLQASSVEQHASGFFLWKGVDPPVTTGTSTHWPDDTIITLIPD